MGALQNNTKGSSSSTTKSKEQVGILAFIDSEQLSVSSDNLELEDSVNTKTKNRGECTVASALYK